ncbi:penicillin-binding protein 1B [Vibrio sp. SS-MA-C1-2]|nr:penicillin-binding protein 1B [Vibrio sp. SS-MA-C1-2]UJF19646.1 penicillin-binding protein 1B [Vibrio sp. SS-MA-C1-2]
MILFAVGVYLDSMVRNKFDGQMWQLPATVYGRVLYLEPGMNISHADVKRELDSLKYLKVQHPRRPGEYSSSKTKIELIRRPFDFEDGPSPSRHVMLIFADHQLQSIKSVTNEKPLGFVRIEPKMLGMLNTGSDEQRIFIPREQFPEILVDALIATEDRGFYQHDGISPLAILRAMVVNLKAGRTVQGGSTLTQQLAKNLFLTRDRTIWRKLQEAYIAVVIDHRYSKDRVLQAYLNEVYLGQNRGSEVHGFGLAARLYFGRPIQELRIDQLAFLVGLVKGPSFYNPWRYPERALNRRDLVLKLMLQQNILTPNEYESAVVRPLDIQSSPKVASRQPAYFQLVKNELKEKLGSIFKPGQGFRVFTTLDPISQEALDSSVSMMIPQLERRSGKGIETAGVIVDRQTGEIRAIVGGSKPGYAGFNRAINASRQIGSLTKPAVYLSALSQPKKYQLATSLQDKPLSIKMDNGETWTPRNYDRKYQGEVPLYLALAKSLNVPSVNLGMSDGLDNVISTLTKLGVDRKEIPDVPSILLGSYTLTPLEVSQMFQTIGNLGGRSQLTALRSVVGLDGISHYQYWPKSKQVVAKQASWLTLYGMKKVVTQGTARSLQSKFSSYQLAGKTGTTDNNRDSWYVGIDGKEVATIWVGRDDNKPTKLTGASGALKIYREYLSLRGATPLQIGWPQGIKTYKYHLNGQNTLIEDCSGTTSLPVWDESNHWKKKCERKPLKWIKSIFHIGD